MLFPSSNILMEQLVDTIFEHKQVNVFILRLDKIHPVVSGNKLFKLHYFLLNAAQQSSAGIATFGGAYSNHLVATAFACKEAGLKSLGIIRGEKPIILSHTLLACLQYGMQLKFISREDYDKKEIAEFQKKLYQEYPNYLVVPEGGYHATGAAGAALIMDLIDESSTHICCAAGTLTTVAGMMLKLKKHQQVLCIPVLKNMPDQSQRINYLLNKDFDISRLTILPDYHFGGYAKKTKGLIDFMNLLYDKYNLPTDFVYTAKMMYAVFDQIENDFFERHSKIVCIHTGGLQGNLSLKPGTLVF